MSKKSSSRPRGRALSPAQAVSMLLVFLLLSGVGGILTAGFAMPFVGVATAITGASEDFFNELPDDFNALEPSQISIIKASDGTEIAKFYAENRIVVPLSAISQNIQNAIVAVEDQRFYQHKGVDPAGIIRAVVSPAGRVLPGDLPRRDPGQGPRQSPGRLPLFYIIFIKNSFFSIRPM